MVKIIASLIRYGLAFFGGGAVCATSDEIAQLAGAIATVAAVVWSIYERRQREKQAAVVTTGGIAPMLVACAILLPVVMCGVGCTTVKTTAADGTATTASTADWDAVDVVVKGSAQTATVLILANNNDLASAFAALNAGAAAVFVGTPTQASLEAAIKALDTGLDDSSVTALSGVLMTAYQYYTVKTGEKTLVAGNAIVKGLVTAFTDGITAGIALHKASI